MNHRLTVTAAIAVVLASTSLSAVINNGGWLYAGIGAVITVAVAGTLTRLSALHAAVAATIIALMACFPMLADRSWYWKAAGLVIVAATAASVTRLRVLPVLAGLVTYLGGLLIYLNIAFAGPESLIRIVPTATSLQHLSHLASSGWALRFFAPPVPGTRGLEVLTAAGIGLIAVATDILAVRLRSPAVAGLPLLVLFSVPITTSAKFTGVGSVAVFCLAISGYLALLAADGRERLRIWGRLVTVWQATEPDDLPARGPDTRALAAAGRRIGLAAVCIAVVAPLILPGLKVHGLFARHPVVSSGTQVRLPTPLVLMRNQLTSAGADKQTVLTYKSTGSPDQATQYLPLYMLNYDPNEHGFSIIQPGLTTGSYTIVVGNRPLHPAPGLNTVQTPAWTVHTRISIGKATSGYGSKLSFLPTPYAPTLINVPGDWQEDNATLMIYSGQTQLGGLNYAVTSEEPNPPIQELTEPQNKLPANILSNYGSYTSTNQAALLAIARQVTKNATTKYDKAVALENWFTSTGGFTYDLSAKFLNTPNSLLDFLTRNKRGYCQQFAYAMATLARLLGIPSRIAVGYTAGTLQPDGSWKVTEADAHAWPELYFQDIGWLRFEPTPGGAQGQGTATQPSYITSPSGPGGSQPQSGPSSSPSAQAPLPTGKVGTGGTLGRSRVNTGDTGPGGVLTASHSASSSIAVALAIVVALAAIAPFTARWLTRRRRWRRAAGDAGIAHAAWQELRDDMRDYGLTVRASESPRAIARRVGAAEELDEDAHQALNRVARAEERASYAVAPEAAGELRADVLAIRRAVARKASRAARWRARLLPASTLEPLRAGLQHSLDVFGWMDAAGQRIRRRVAGEAITNEDA